MLPATVAHEEQERNGALEDEEGLNKEINTGTTASDGGSALPTEAQRKFVALSSGSALRSLCANAKERLCASGLAPHELLNGPKSGTPMQQASA